MSDCKMCVYLDRFNCCCSYEPIMTCKAEMEEHYKTVRADAIEECRDLIIALYHNCETTTELCANFRDGAEQLKEQKNDQRKPLY